MIALWMAPTGHSVAIVRYVEPRSLRRIHTSADAVLVESVVATISHNCQLAWKGNLTICESVEWPLLVSRYLWFRPLTQERQVNEIDCSNRTNNHRRYATMSWWNFEMPTWSFEAYNRFVGALYLASLGWRIWEKHTKYMCCTLLWPKQVVIEFRPFICSFKLSFVAKS